MDIDYFALVHHVDFGHEATAGIRMHNYPESWQLQFDSRRLGRSDPVHRASHNSTIGFPWSRIPFMIKLTPADRETFADAERLGIGDGYTVPAHAPGELNGSCSFAVATGRSFPQQHHLIAQLVGGLAFEAARLLVMPPELRSAELPVLTGRQRECVVLAAQGHTDPQIAKILDIRPDTAVQHMKQARDRWGLHNRMSLGVRALFFQVISFAEVFGGNPHFWE